MIYQYLKNKQIPYLEVAGITNQCIKSGLY